MDEYGNMKAGQFKNDPLSLAMASVPVFPPRPMPGTGNPFQNPAMSSPYSFNMDGTIGHPSSIYNPPPTHHSNVAKMNHRPSDADVRQMSHGFPKPPPMAYHNFSPLSSCNIVTTNGFFNLNAPSDMSKHSFEDVLNSPPNFNPDPSMNTQMIPPKTQYLEPVSSVMTDMNNFSQESVNSYVQNLNPVPLVTQMVESKKRTKSQKILSKSTSTNIMQMNSADLNQVENGRTPHSRTADNHMISERNSEGVTNSDMLSKLCSSTGIFKCGFCELKMSSMEALLGHLNTHTDLLPYSCGICGTVFIEGSQLMKHVQHSHAVKAPYACGLCTSAFHQNTELKAHIETHEKQEGSASLSKTQLPPLNKDKEKPSSRHEVSLKDEEIGGDEEEDAGAPETLNPIPALNPVSNTILIGKGTDFTLRRGPSKIVMDDVDISQACTIIVEPSSAGGIRKKHLFKCNYCDKVCKDKGSLVSHVRTHTKGRPYECNICYAKFKQYAHLSDHIMTKHTKDRPFVCDRCAKTFNRKSHLQDHIRLRHTEDKLYHCTECPATFLKRSEFSEHKRTHGKPPPKYQCNMCPRQFRNVTDFERHIRSHTKEKRYECEVCHLTFGLLANAKKHMIKHNEERPFKCDVCQKAYHFEHDFKRHRQTHLKKKAFPCPDCYKSFKKAALLKKHAKEAHLKTEADPAKKHFKCLACKKHFKFQWDLDRHRKIHAKKKPFPCLYCYKTYGSEAMLVKHIRVHDGQTLPFYDHSKDVECDGDDKPKRRGRKPKVKQESDDQSQDTADDSYVEETPPKRRGRLPKRKTVLSKLEDKSPKRPRRATKKRNDSETGEWSAPSLKFTFKRKKPSKKKFECEECDKSFVSKALLKRHSKMHEDESDDAESFLDSESTNSATLPNEKTRTKTIPSKKGKRAIKVRATRSSRKTVTSDHEVKKVDETVTDDNIRDDDVSREGDTTRDSDITREGDSTRDGESTRDDDTMTECDKTRSSDNTLDDDTLKDAGNASGNNDVGKDIDNEGHDEARRDIDSGREDDPAGDNGATRSGVTPQDQNSTTDLGNTMEEDSTKKPANTFESEDQGPSLFTGLNDSENDKNKHTGNGYFSQVNKDRKSPPVFQSNDMPKAFVENRTCNILPSSEQYSQMVAENEDHSQNHITTQEQS